MRRLITSTRRHFLKYMFFKVKYALLCCAVFRVCYHSWCISLTILSSVLFSAYFRQIAGRYKQMTNDQTLTVVDVNDCAQACNDPTKLEPCNSFDYCATNNLCGLSRRHAEDGQLATGGGYCDHYDSKFFLDVKCTCDIVLLLILIFFS